MRTKQEIEAKIQKEMERFFDIETEIKVWTDLCDEHARMLIDEDDYEGVNRLKETDWPCLVEGCDERATVQGQVRVSPPFKKVQ